MPAASEKPAVGIFITPRLLFDISPREQTALSRPSYLVNAPEKRLPWDTDLT